MPSHTSKESLSDVSSISSLSSDTGPFDAAHASDEIASFYQKMTIMTTRQLPARNVQEGQAPYVFETVEKTTETIIDHSLTPPNKMLRRSRVGHVTKHKVSGGDEAASSPEAATPPAANPPAAAGPVQGANAYASAAALSSNPGSTAPRIICYVDDTRHKAWPTAPQPRVDHASGNGNMFQSHFSGESTSLPPSTPPAATHANSASISSPAGSAQRPSPSGEVQSQSIISPPAGSALGGQLPSLSGEVQPSAPTPSGRPLEPARSQSSQLRLQQIQAALDEVSAP